MTLYRAWSLQCLPTRVSGSRVDDPEEEAETMRARVGQPLRVWTAANQEWAPDFLHDAVELT